MSTPAEQFAVRFAMVNDDVIAAVLGCSDEQWRQSCASEGWSVGVAAHHVAEVHRDFSGLLKALAAGETRSPGSSMAEVNRSNAQHARDFATVTRPETIEALRANGAAVAHLLSSLGDEQLEHTAGVFGGRELSVARVVEWIVIGHAEVHLASIHTTITA